METKTRTLAGFLLARIAEDECAAWLQRESMSTVAPEAWPRVERLIARALADCEAKWRIVELHQLSESYAEPDGPHPACAECGYALEYPRDWPCSTLRALAAIYGGHPDFDESWRL